MEQISKKENLKIVQGTWSILRDTSNLFLSLAKSPAVFPGQRELSLLGVEISFKSPDIIRH